MEFFRLPWPCTVCFQLLLFTLDVDQSFIILGGNTLQKAVWLIECRFSLKCFFCTFCVRLSSSLHWEDQCTSRWYHRHTQFLILTLQLSTQNVTLRFSVEPLTKQWNWSDTLTQTYFHFADTHYQSNTLNLFFSWIFPCTCDKITDRPSGWKLGLNVHRKSICLLSQSSLSPSLPLYLTLSAWHLKADFSWNL